jgi:hypothetical protein
LTFLKMCKMALRRSAHRIYLNGGLRKSAFYCLCFLLSWIIDNSFYLCRQVFPSASTRQQSSLSTAASRKAMKEQRAARIWCNIGQDQYSSGWSESGYLLTRRTNLWNLDSDGLTVVNRPNVLIMLLIILKWYTTNIWGLQCRLWSFPGCSCFQTNLNCYKPNLFFCTPAHRKNLLFDSYVGMFPITTILFIWIHC